MDLRHLLSSWSKKDTPRKEDDRKPAIVQAAALELPHNPLSSTSPSNDEFSQLSASVVGSPTINEIRAGRPLTPGTGYQGRTRRNSLSSTNSQQNGPTSSSDNELGKSPPHSGSDSNDDSDTESEGGLPKNDEYRVVTESPLQTHQCFQAIQPNLLQFLYTKVQAWISSAQYAVPPDDRLPPCKRARTADIQSPPPHLEEEDFGFEFVNIPRRDGFYHLACPYYVLNPQKYQGCLLQHDLQSIEDVISHLRRCHTQPAYCPLCYLAFDKASDRDKHIQARTCQLRDSRTIDGLNEYQKTKLGKRDRLCAGESTRWMRVWATIFPKTKPHRSPYLEGYAERTVSMTWDYWEIYGKDGVSEYLAIHGFPRTQMDDKQRALAALHSLILQDLIHKVFEEYGSA